MNELMPCPGCGAAVDLGLDLDGPRDPIKRAVRCPKYPHKEKSELLRCLGYAFMCGDDAAADVIRRQIADLTQTPGCSPRWFVACELARVLRVLLVDTAIVEKAENEARLVECVEIARKVTDR